MRTLRIDDVEGLPVLDTSCGSREARPDYMALAAREEDLASVRDDPRFPR